ncbi:GNAT domain protein [Kalmanozyma brasiliensis GHG001]|uniref:N-acetyltransferase domain-containing protein n=1 Tax=Kalmanozyma brasiliensis (strain GHG001) TaxID=1365824 RepID=V5ESG5_KALBG|nr:GNAT domain protein [Kalmanozyma brasiliensis GHG001]EST04854.1 GNAT domain protein [Kalmanozyma brasiliensis GHG001]
MTTDSTPQRFVTRLTRQSEIPDMARIQYDAFNDPHSTMPDELPQIAALDVDPTVGRPPTRDESIAKTIQRFEAVWAKNKYTIVGVYLLPPTANDVDIGEGSDTDSSSLPEGSVLVGQATWQRLDEHSPLDAPEMEEQEKKEPVLIHRFMAQIHRTRETLMKGKTYWFLKVLTIDPKFQRKGLGTLLVKWGTKRADREGVNAWLESSPMGKGAYLKAGFRVLGMDRVDEPRAKKGYLEWPYMIHEPTQ